MYPLIEFPLNAAAAGAAVFLVLQAVERRIVKARGMGGHLAQPEPEVDHAPPDLLGGATEEGTGPRGDDVVQLQGDDDELVASAVAYLTAAMEAREVALVVATGDHRRRFQAAMAARGVDVAAAQRDGSYLAVDAALTMSRFMIDGHVNGVLFRSVVGQLMSAVSKPGRPVRAYGEMAALLWDAGHVNAAIDVGWLWNELGDVPPFSLFCAPLGSGSQDRERRRSTAHVSTTGILWD